MEGFITNIETAVEDNNDFRRVLFTGPNSQLVVMSLESGEDIGSEVHQVDQFIRIEEGNGSAVLDGEEQDIHSGWAIVVPAGVEHNIINKGDEGMKIYTVYSPPEHPDGTIHHTKEDASNEEE